MSDNINDTDIAENEFSYLIDSTEIGSKPVRVEVLVPDDIVAAICKRLGLASIEKLTANITLERNSVNKAILVQGIVHSELHQKCVITSEPVKESINDEFRAWFAEPNSTVSFVKAKRERMNRKEKSDQPIMEECDDPEAIIDGKIDLGELVVQHFSLSLNPYPRAEGAEYENKGKELGEAPEGTFDNPFAALKDWKSGEAKKDK